MQRSVTNVPAAEEAPSIPFADFLNGAIAGTVEADVADKAANLGLMFGDLTDLHTATIAAQRAEIVLSLTLQIRNKIVEAYQEVMRMNV
jgi:flagellar hook-basal body complex protein FliE